MSDWLNDLLFDNSDTDWQEYLEWRDRATCTSIDEIPFHDSQPVNPFSFVASLDLLTAMNGVEYHIYLVRGNFAGFSALIEIQLEEDILRNNFERALSHLFQQLNYSLRGYHYYLSDLESFISSNSSFEDRFQGNSNLISLKNQMRAILQEAWSMIISQLEELAAFMPEKASEIRALLAAA